MWVNLRLTGQYALNSGCARALDDLNKAKPVAEYKS